MKKGEDDKYLGSKEKPELEDEIEAEETELKSADALTSENFEQEANGEEENRDELTPNEKAAKEANEKAAKEAKEAARLEAAEKARLEALKQQQAEALKQQQAEALKQQQNKSEGSNAVLPNQQQTETMVKVISTGENVFTAELVPNPTTTAPKPGNTVVTV